MAQLSTTYLPGISILISTYNGEQKLRKTLEGLAGLNTFGIPAVELILVDNASTDQSASKADAWWRELGTPFPLNIFHEPKPGKLNAQELGLSKVRFAYCLICDDDNQLFSDYLQIGTYYLNRHPEIGVLGGQGIAVSAGPLPEWFPKYAYFYACAPQALKTGPVYATRNVVYGAGMWLRMEGYLLAKGKGFSFILSSRTGNSLATGGEDSELCWALRYAGYEIWYADEMKFYHHLPDSRLTASYLNKLLAGMHANGPLGNTYLRIWKKGITKPVQLFWLKEAIYTILYIIRLPFNQQIPPEMRSQDFKRSVYNLRYLLSERKDYDHKINQLLAYYQKFRQA